MASINDLREPIEVYEAAVGDVETLVEYLRSDQPIGSWMREVLAFYLAGELEPKLPKGRPKKDTKVSKLMRMAAMEYRSRLYWAKKEGKPVYGKAEALRGEIAKNYGIIPEQFEQEFHRGIPNRKTVIGLQDRFVDWYINHRMK
ncbi:hypothetical protein N9571_06205 [Yoonia sp.]|uniref:hypothetical protein n=1 Tax=Yoonia sp. TaxID=2212373 RepID=UPI0023762E3F|nr:hypothetical protein [Yoonia sp.]MDB4112126.1 hypothetical protein [Yoonia sp.]